MNATLPVKSRFTVAKTQFAQKTPKFGRPKFRTFRVTTIVASLWQNPHFFCETLFSGARFPVRRVVLVKNPICIIIIIIIVYYYHYYHYFFVTCCDPCLCWEIDMPSIAFCRRLRQVPPPPDGMPGMPCVGGMRGGQGWPWDHGMRDNLHGTHMKKWELIGFTSSYGSFNGEHDGEQ